MGYPWYGYGGGYGYPQIQSSYPATYYSDPSLAGAQEYNNPPDTATRQYPKVWHFCPQSNGYYPTVKLCPSGWTEIPQIPEGQTEDAWYLCHAPEGYYPYVRHCDKAWDRVAPTTTHGVKP